MKQVTDSGQCEGLWHRLRKHDCHPALETYLENLSRYEQWKADLEKGVASFWTLQGERLAFLVAYEEGEPVGLVRVLRVSIYPWDKADWRGSGFRGEIQDLFWQGTSEDAAGELVKKGIGLLREKGIERVGVSCWRPEQCEVVKKLGLRPLRRNILLGWRTDSDLRVKPKLSCQIRYVEPGEEKLVQEVFTSTWGFKVDFLPHREGQSALVAIQDDRPIGTVLLNYKSGSIDLGVQVVSEQRRGRIGSLLIREALNFYRKKGFEHMYLIRDIPVNGLRREDEIALQFYASTNAFPIREYVGFRNQ